MNNETGRRIEDADQEYYAVATDMMIKIRDAVEKGTSSLVYVYYPWIDHLEHMYGPSSEAVSNAVRTFFTELENVVIPTLKKSDYKLVITADHGQIEAGGSIVIGGNSEIIEYAVGPPWGDERILYFNALSGKEAKFKECFERSYGKGALLFDSDSLISTGIFGKAKVNGKVRYRFGTHIAIAKRNSVFAYEYPRETHSKHRKHVGVHSGPSKEEMEVPLIVY